MHFEDLEVNEWPDTDANPSELPALFGEKSGKCQKILTRFLHLPHTSQKREMYSTC